MTSLAGNSTDPNTPAVQGVNTGDGGSGVFGRDDSVHGGGVIGHSQNGRGVYGESLGPGTGVWGFSQTSTGVVGESGGSGAGVIGKAASGRGVYGESGGNGQGVWGFSQSDSGVVGVSGTGIGVFGKGGRLAAHFEGSVEVTGDILLTNADCAEEFDIDTSQEHDPGTVMVIGDANKLHLCTNAYDKRVAGVISGAGDCRPGLVLGRQSSARARMPIALTGTVYCKVDAQAAPIGVGDLSTTSSTPGHAMKATDAMRAFGAVIGKA